MIEPLADTPPGVLGFRVSGEVQREDYEDVLTPALKQALDSGDGLRTLYLIESLDKMDPSALWADAKVGYDLGIRHHDAWVRSAIVTDIDWLARATRLFAWMIPARYAYSRSTSWSRRRPGPQAPEPPIAGRCARSQEPKRAGRARCSTEPKGQKFEPSGRSGNRSAWRPREFTPNPSDAMAGIALTATGEIASRML